MRLYSRLMKFGFFLLIFMASEAFAHALYSPEKAIEDAKGLSSPSVESFLQTLQPDFLSQHVILYNSNSNQFASAKSPRVLMFNENMVMTFNGERHGSTQVEIIHFNPQSKTFDFYDLNFNGGLLKVEKNPTTCFNCHVNRRPLWSSATIYPFWAGAFGSGTAMATKNEEEQTLKSFIESTEHSARYKVLQPYLQNTIAYFPEKEGSARSLLHQNSRFEQNLSRWIAQSIFQRLRQEPLFKPLRASLLAILACSFDEIPGWTCKPEQLRELLAELTPVKKEGWQQIWARDLQASTTHAHVASGQMWTDMSRALNVPYEELMGRMKHFSKAPPISDKYASITAGLYLVQRDFFLIDFVRQFSTHLEPQVVEYAGDFRPWGTLGRLEQLLIDSVLQDYPELHIENLRKRKIQKLDTIGDVQYTHWSSAESMKVALTTLYALDDIPFHCEYILSKVAND